MTKRARRLVVPFALVAAGTGVFAGVPAWGELPVHPMPVPGPGRPTPSLCGAQGQLPCPATAAKPGCDLQPTSSTIGSGQPIPSMGRLGGRCEPCGDLNQPVCDAAWQPPTPSGQTPAPPWFAGCNAASVAMFGQPLVAAAGTCVGCGLPNQPVCACPPSSPGCSVNASIVVDRSKTQGAIAPGFTGLSFQKWTLNQGLFTASNTPLVNLFKQLGPSIVRIGAGGKNGVDNEAWGTAITNADVDALSGFLTATGWSAIYGINMLTNCTESGTGGCPQVAPDVAASEAGYVASSLGAKLYGFELGNEPDLYAKRQEGNMPNYAAFLADWLQTLYPPMHAAAPGAAFTGPGSALNVGTYTVPFAHDAAADIVLLTQHYYRTYVPDGSLNCETAWTPGPGTATTPSCSGLLAELLTPDPTLAAPATGILDQLAAAASANHIAHGYRIAETNSFSGGGVPGVSDAYGSALWMIDFLFANAQHGSSGVNISSGGFGDDYTPIADNQAGQVCDTGTAGNCHLFSDGARPADPAIRPPYYGMLFFTQAGTGNLLPAKVTLAAGINLTAYVVAVDDYATSVVLVNKDPTKTAHATIDLAKSTAAATVTMLTGPSLTATSGFTLGGTAIPPGTPWAATSMPALPVSGTTVTVDVPPASAALVRAKEFILRPVPRH